MSSKAFLPDLTIRAAPDSFCPYCRLEPRHRLLWLYLQQRTDFFDGRPKKMLHVAPEPYLEIVFRKIRNIDYTTADLMDPWVDVKMDVTDIQYPDGSFDVVYCSHVLEHVPDDRKAMREFRRILRPGGWAIILVPINAEKTIEDPSITDPQERLRLFNQEDHVRKYGPDYTDRLIEAGFTVDVAQVADLAGAAEAERMAIASKTSGFIHYCRL
jgi:SAM-dependent methyltransferase